MHLLGVVAEMGALSSPRYSDAGLIGKLDFVNKVYQWEGHDIALDDALQGATPFISKRGLYCPGTVSFVYTQSVGSDSVTGQGGWYYVGYPILGQFRNRLINDLKYDWTVVAEFETISETPTTPNSLNYFAWLLDGRAGFNGGEVFLDFSYRQSFVGNDPISDAELGDTDYLWTTLGFNRFVDNYIREGATPVPYFPGSFKIAATRTPTRLAVAINGEDPLPATFGDSVFFSGTASFAADNNPLSWALGGYYQWFSASFGPPALGEYAFEPFYFRSFALYEPQANARLAKLSHHPVRYGLGMLFDGIGTLSATLTGPLYLEPVLFHGGIETDITAYAQRSNPGESLFPPNPGMYVNVTSNRMNMLWPGAGAIVLPRLNAHMLVRALFNGQGTPFQPDLWRRNANGFLWDAGAIFNGAGAATATVDQLNPWWTGLGEQSAASGNTFQPITLPTPRQNGDLMIAFMCVTQSSGISMSVSGAGWHFGGQVNGSGNTTIGWAWCLVNGSEGAPTFTWGTPLGAVWRLFLYRGNDIVAPIGNVDTASGSGVELAFQASNSSRDHSRYVLGLCWDTSGTWIETLSQPVWPKNGTATGLAYLGNTVTRQFHERGTWLRNSTPPLFRLDSSVAKSWNLLCVEVLATSPYLAALFNGQGAINLSLDHYLVAFASYRGAGEIRGSVPDGLILLSGDAQSGTDKLLFSGDVQSGTDREYASNHGLRQRSVMQASFAGAGGLSFGPQAGGSSLLSGDESGSPADKVLLSGDATSSPATDHEAWSLSLDVQ